MPQKNKN